MPYSDQEIIDGIQKKEEKKYFKIIQWVCNDKDFNAPAENLLKNMGASTEDIRDIIIEGQDKLIHNVERNKYKGEAPLNAYFKLICKYIYLNKLRKPSIETSNLADQANKISDFEASVEEEIIKMEQLQLLKKSANLVLDLLSEACQKVLIMYYRGFPMDRIASEMQYKGESSAKTKALKCRKELRKRVKANPELMRIIKNRLDGKF